MPTKKSPLFRAFEHAYIWQRFFPGPVTAGFTRPTLKGDVLLDMSAALAPAGMSPAIAFMKQVHGPEVKNITEAGIYVCDGIFTGISGLALVVRTADCLPLIFYSEKMNISGVVHMGWRSAAGGILENIGYDLSSFICVAGVGLRTCCYRVGTDFTAHERVKEFVRKTADSLIFDPIAFARHHLIRKGLRPENFFDAGICSYCSPDGFHSHRRTGTPDRTLSFIVRL